MNSGDLARRLADCRLREARALIKAGEWSGAYYLAGYAVELLIKSRMAIAIASSVLPDPKLLERARTHDIVRLRDHEWANLSALPSEVRDKFSRLGRWSEQSRYLEHTQEDAEALVADVEEIYAEIANQP